MDSTGRLAPLKNQKGFTFVYVALIITALFGFLGLAVDVGHLYVVRGKLQNAADSAAMAGAWSLYRDSSSPGVVLALDWERAQTAATNYIRENSSDLGSNVSLVDGTIEVGYWNLTTKILQSQTITPTSQDVPAVRATISRSGESNGGPVSTFFMKILDAANDSAPVSSLPSVAVCGYPGGVPGGVLFPMAVSSCMTDTYFLQDPLPTEPVSISSLYTPGGETCQNGQWTSLTDFTNGASVVSGYITDASSPPVQTGDPIWIQTGKENVLYNVSDIWVGKDVLMPIISGNTGTITKDTVNKALPIQGFVLFHIDSVDKGNDPNITGHFIERYTTLPGIIPGGSISDTVTPPLMVQ